MTSPVSPPVFSSSDRYHSLSRAMNPEGMDLDECCDDCFPEAEILVDSVEELSALNVDIKDVWRKAER